MITYIVFQIIESVVLKTTCFAISQTFNAGTYLLSQLFFKPRRDRNKYKHVYLQDVIVHDVRMGDIRSKYIDYADSEDESDNEYEEYIRPNTPEVSAMTRHEVSRHEVSSDDDEKHITENVHEDIEKALPPIITNETASTYSMHTDNDALEKQVQIIKEIINDEKYIKEIKKKEQLEKYLHKTKISHETDNEWVNIQVFDDDELVFVHHL
jgi:hypothetical protein